MHFENLICAPSELALRSSAYTEGGGVRGKKPKQQPNPSRTRHGVSLAPRICFGICFRSPKPVGLGRGAQPKADQGERLSEPKASSSLTPLLASTAGCLERSGRTQTIGSPFFWVLFFGEAKTKCLARRGETRLARSASSAQAGNEMAESGPDRRPDPHTGQTTPLSLRMASSGTSCGSGARSGSQPWL